MEKISKTVSLDAMKKGWDEFKNATPEQESQRKIRKGKSFYDALDVLETSNF